MAIDKPAFVPLSAPPHRATPDSATRVLISGGVSSGKRTLAKAIIGTPHPKLGPAPRPITIRTREGVLEPGGKGGVSEPGEADYLVLVVDGTRAGDLAELANTLSLLPLAWWRHTAVVITKVDLRSRAAFRPQQLTKLVHSYYPTTPIFFSSPSSLPTIAQRVRRLVVSSGAGSLRSLQGLRVERPPRFLKADGEED